MIIDRTHIRWGLFTAVASAAAALFYLANNDPDDLRKWGLAITLPAWFGPVPPLRGNVGATPLGLVYGTIALLIFIFAALLGARRNNKSWPLGPIQTWLKAHIWLTILTIPLVLFHSGFHGGGPMTEFLLGLYAFVMVSGFWGLALQHVIPRLMRDSLPEEIIFEQIPFIRSQLNIEGEAIRRELESQPEEPALQVDLGDGEAVALMPNTSTAVTSVINFLERQALPYLKTLNPRGLPLRNKQASDDQFRLLKLKIPEAIHSLLDRMQGLCDEKRRLDLQTRLHYWLHGWLLVHAPASILLLVLTILHAVVATFIYA